MGRMNVSLTKHQKNFVKARVDSGQYQSASEVVREALRVLENLEFERDWLEAEIEKGIESGPAIPVDGNYWKRFRKRLASERTQRSKAA
jgi:antitoxin ParD1/3/4